MARSLRARAVCTLAYCLSFVGLGFMPGVVGPTLPSLSNRTQIASPAALAPVYVARALFYGAGTVVMGALIDRLGRHTHRIYVAWQVFMCVCGALIPWTGSLWPLVVAVAGMNFAGGAVEHVGTIST